MTSRDEWMLAHQEKAVDLSKEALRTVVLLNGAAAIALLAFIGQIIKEAPSLLATLSYAIQWFVGGAVMGGLATVVAYSSQRLIAESQNWLLKEIVFWLAVAFVVLAYVGFIGGASIASTAVVHYSAQAGPAPAAPIASKPLPIDQRSFLDATLHDPGALATWALVAAAGLAAFFAWWQVRTFKKFELLKYIEGSEVRWARRKVYHEIRPKRGEKWWNDVDSNDLAVKAEALKMEEAAALVCASFDILGLVARRFWMRRFFAKYWANGIVRSYDILKPYVDHRREVQPSAYRFYIELYDQARPHARPEPPEQLPSPATAADV